MDYFISMQPRSYVRFSALFRDQEEKSSYYSNDFPSMILQKIICVVKRLNPGMNTRFWTQKDVTRSKEFMAAIERRLKTRRIFRNLECFVGGRVRDIDYKLLQRTE
ncbi:hypothetical protein Tco_0414769 [Tanacetum coccineum]